MTTGEASLLSPRENLTFDPAVPDLGGGPPEAPPQQAVAWEGNKESDRSKVVVSAARRLLTADAQTWFASASPPQPLATYERLGIELDSQ